MSHFVYVPSAFCSGSFTSLSESFERVVRPRTAHRRPRGGDLPVGGRGAVELLKVPVEERDEVLGGGVPDEGEEELRPHILQERAANSRERASNSQEEPPNRSVRNWQQRAKKFWP